MFEDKNDVLMDSECMQKAVNEPLSEHSSYYIGLFMKILHL
jgi:hypothetical protein